MLLSDNGFEWGDRRASGTHPADRVCAARGIEHRHTRVRRPQTNGMVERFNRRLTEDLDRAERIQDNSGRNCFSSHSARDAFVRRPVFNSNRTRQVALKHRSPLEALQSLTNPPKRNKSNAFDAWVNVNIKRGWNVPVGGATPDRRYFNSASAQTAAPSGSA